MPDLQQPTAFEQQVLEYINRMRLDPHAEIDAILLDDTAAGQANISLALSYFGVDETALRAQFDSLVSVAPVAWNANLAQAAETHSDAMRTADQQSHQLPGELWLGDRITAEGYTDWTQLGENIFAYVNSPLQAHAGFAIDWGYDAEDFDDGELLSNWQTLGDGIQDPAGHRDNIMSGLLTEVGIGAVEQTEPGTSTGPYLITQDFGARSSYEAQLLGVVIDDGDDDRFYDIGEGMGGVTVTATGDAGTFVTTSWAAGGYQMVLPDGVYRVSFSGSGLTNSVEYSITIGADNIKLDAFAADAALRDPMRLTGTEDVDVLIGGLGDDILIGGAAADELDGAGGNDLLLGDGLSVQVTGDISAQVFRLYQATLSRAPDSAGHRDWVTRLYTGEMDLQEAASLFVASVEFQAIYGALGNAAFVELLYENTLNRPSDPTGFATWMGRLEDGTSRAEVVLGFAESLEFVANTASDAAQYTEGNSPQMWSDDVFRLYQATLDRAPDPGGFAGWVGQLGEGREYLEVVNGFVDSTEFSIRYGALENDAFIELLYENVLGRASDPAGKADWLSQMEDGASQAEVVSGFAQSLEFRNATIEQLEAWMRAHTEDDVLIGRKGSDVMVGGLGADVFIFAPDDADGAGAGAPDRVLDLEAWDSIDLTAFNFADVDAARTAFVQNDVDVVFDAVGVNVVFEQSDLAMFDANMLLV